MVWWSAARMGEADAFATSAPYAIATDDAPSVRLGFIPAPSFDRTWQHTEAARPLSRAGPPWFAKSVAPYRVT